MAKICDLEFLVNAFLQMMRVFHIVIRDYSFATLNYSVIPERQGSVHSFLAWEREQEGERERERESERGRGRARARERESEKQAFFSNIAKTSYER